MKERLFILEKTKALQLNSFLHRHPRLDRRGGGERTFRAVRLALPADPDNGSVVRAYAATWHMPDDWLVSIRDEVLRRGWKINDPTANDVAVYDMDIWTFDQAMADTTRKGFPLRWVGDNSPYIDPETI
jgi:hypothetical protein